AIAAEDTVRFQVRGVSMGNPGIVRAAQPRAVHLSNEPMNGGIYYWATTGSQSAYGIFRHDMADAGVPAEEYLTTNQTAGRCSGCHAVSGDGSRLTAAYDGGPNGAGAIVDIATKAAQPVTNNWDFSALSPDGKQLFTIWGYTLMVRDADTQAVLATMTETP